MRYDRLPGLLVLCSLLPAGTVQGQTGGGATGLPEPRAPHGATRGGPPLAHDAGGEGGADDVPLERQAADHRRPGALRPRPCAGVVPGGDRPDRAPERRPRGACRGGVHQRDPAVGEGEHAPRHPRDLPRGGAARAAGAGGDQLPAGHRPGEHLGPGPGGARLRRGRAGRCGPGARSRCSPRWWTWPATRAGGGSRRPTARTRTWCRGWAWRRCAASRGAAGRSRPST